MLGNVLQVCTGLYTLKCVMHLFDLWKIQDPFHVKETSTATSTATSTTAMLDCVYCEPVHLQ